MNKTKIKKIAISAVFAALIAATAWISVPTPFGVNLAFTIFGVCLTGFVLGVKYGLMSTVVYIALGAIGLPVFSQFMSGFGILLGASGGFLWGFLITAALCGISKNMDKKALKIPVMILSVLICHAVGVAQFCIVSGNGILTGFITASLPFLVKDLILVFLADFVSKKIKNI